MMMGFSVDNDDSYGSDNDDDDCGDDNDDDCGSGGNDDDISSHDDDDHDCGLVWSGLFGFFGISTLVDYWMSNPFLYKETVLFQTIQFSMSTQFNYQKHFYFSLIKQF